MITRQDAILVVGTKRDGEFTEPLLWLEQRARVCYCQEIDDAIRLASSDTPVIKAVVFLADSPWSVGRVDVQAVQRYAPLARIVVLGGVWAVGYGRRASSAAGPELWYWHQFIDRCAREWFSDTSFGQAWPLTATLVDKLVAEPPLRGPMGLGSQSPIVVHAPTRTHYEAIADVLEIGGWSSLWWPPHQPKLWQRASALVWNLVQPSPAACDQLQQAAHRLQPLPVVVLMGFPLPEHFEQLAPLSNVSILAKPFLARDLLDRLDRMATQHEKDSTHRR